MINFPSAPMPYKPSPGNANASRSPDGNTYLHELCERHAPADLLREAVHDLGADINKTNKKGIPPLGISLRNSKAVTTILLDLGAELYVPATDPKDSFSAILTCIEINRPDMLSLVLENGGGVHLNKPGNGKGLYALHTAVSLGFYDLTKQLTAAGALMNEPDASPLPKTPLALAAENNSATGIDKLLSLGADIDQPLPVTGRTALHHAAALSKNNAADRLLRHGAQTGLHDADGKTPLMLAADAGNTEMIRSLLKAQAGVNVKNPENGETALMCAAKKGSADIVRLLLEAGADPLLTNKFNQTALTLGNRQTSVPAYAVSLCSLLEKAEAEHLNRRFEKSYRKHKP